MNTDEHGFLDGPRMTVNLLMYNVEMFWIQWMPCCAAVLVDRGGCLEMFFNSVT